MQSARHEFLARARFAENAHPGFGWRNPIDLRHHLFHGLAGEDDLMIAEALTQLLIFRFEPLQAKGILDRKQKLLCRNWFLQKVQGTELRGPHCHLDVCLTRHHYNRCHDATPAQFLQECEPVLSGHHNIREDQVEAVGFRDFERLVRIVANRRIVTGEAESARERGESAGLVIKDQQVGFSCQNILLSGRAIREYLPRHR